MRAIAIDGPAGAGKSSVARAVAQALGFLYVDTGAMYRAIVFKAQRLGVDLEDEEAMGDVARTARLAFDPSGARILLDGEDVSDAIRSPLVTRLTRFSARAAPVREVLVRQQREMAHRQKVVMEGRDITTVVLADADWKFFLTASPEERAQRRAKEMQEAGHEVDSASLLEDIRNRDQSDAQVGPLRDAMELALSDEGAIVYLDTTDMRLEDVVQTIIGHVRRDR